MFALCASPFVACRSLPPGQVGPSCETAADVGSDWRVLRSDASGIEMRHPPAYVLKDWSNVSNPGWGKKVDLWLNDSPSTTVAFARTFAGDLRFAASEDVPGRTCTIRVTDGVWQVRTYTQYTSQDGVTRRALFVVAARMAIPADTLILKYLGLSRDTLQQATQVTMLRGFKLLGH